MRGKQILHLLLRHVLVHRQHQRVVSQMARRINQRTLTIGNDKELISLNGMIPGIFHQIVKHHADVFAVIVKFNSQFCSRWEGYLNMKN